MKIDVNADLSIEISNKPVPGKTREGKPVYDLVESFNIGQVPNDIARRNKSSDIESCVIAEYTSKRFGRRFTIGRAISTIEMEDYFVRMKNSVGVKRALDIQDNKGVFPSSDFTFLPTGRSEALGRKRQPGKVVRPSPHQAMNDFTTGRITSVNAMVENYGWTKEEADHWRESMSTLFDTLKPTRDKSPHVVAVIPHRGDIEFE